MIKTLISLLILATTACHSLDHFIYKLLLNYRCFPHYTPEVWTHRDGDRKMTFHEVLENIVSSLIKRKKKITKEKRNFKSFMLEQQHAPYDKARNP